MGREFQSLVADTLKGLLCLHNIYQRNVNYKIYRAKQLKELHSVQKTNKQKTIGYPGRTKLFLVVVVAFLIL